MAFVAESKCKYFAQLRFDYSDSYTNDNNKERSNLLIASLRDVETIP